MNDHDILTGHVFAHAKVLLAVWKSPSFYLGGFESKLASNQSRKDAPTASSKDLQSLHSARSFACP